MNVRTVTSKAVVENNYIRVDEDGDEIHVYDCGDEVYRKFTGGTRISRRADALSYARKQAKKLGCDYGDNFGG